MPALARCLRCFFFALRHLGYDARMITSGVVLDVYDDVGGEVLRSMFPSHGDVPGFVKAAHALTPVEMNQLPDESFALVLVNGEETLRKFACTDEGNTALSVLYFVKNAHKLPEEVQQVTAANLKVACGWYGLDVPAEIEKAATIAANARAEDRSPTGMTPDTMTDAAEALAEKKSREHIRKFTKTKEAVSKDFVRNAVAKSTAGAERLGQFAAHMGTKARDASGRMKGLAQTAELSALKKGDQIEKGTKALGGALTGMAQQTAKKVAPAAGKMPMKDVPKEVGKNLARHAAGVGAIGLGGVGAYHAAKAIAPSKEKAAGLAGFVARRAAANPVGTAMTAMTVPSLVKGTKQGIQQNLAQVRAGESMGGIGGGLHAMSHKLASGDAILEEAFKVADVTGTALMPNSVAPKKPTTTLAGTIMKSAHMNPVFDATGLEPVHARTVKTASRHALGDRYPLDTYGQVKQASDYFAEYGRLFTPAESHEFCVNLVKRASELAIELPEIVEKYGSEKYASAEELQIGIDCRKQVVDPMDKEACALLDDLSTQRAMMPPEDYALVLESFDKTAGIDHLYTKGDVWDPYYSTFGKTAAAKDEDFKDSVGNFFVTGQDLKILVQNQHWLKSTFGDDFAEEYSKDPVGIYKSLPVEQKKLIIRMATENSPR